MFFTYIWSFILLQSDRLKQVQDYLCTLCLVLGINFKRAISEVHPNLGDSEVLKSITNGTLGLLSAAIQQLRGFKIQRMQRLIMFCVSSSHLVIFFAFLFSVYVVDPLYTGSYKILRLFCWRYGV